MNEARRFLRNVIPGLVFLGVVGFLTYLSHPCQIEKRWDRELNLGHGAVLVLGAATIGYLLASIHHLLYHTVYVWLRLPVRRLRRRLSRLTYTWTCDLTKSGPINRCLGLSALRLCRALARCALLHVRLRRLAKTAIRERKSGPCAPEKPGDEVDAWCLIETLWYPAHKTEPEISNKAYKRQQQLWDLMHAAGATALGALCAFLFWAYLALCQLDSAQGSRLVALLAGVIIVAVLYINYGVLVRIVGNVTRMQTRQILHARKVDKAETEETAWG